MAVGQDEYLDENGQYPRLNIPGPPDATSPLEATSPPDATDEKEDKEPPGPVGKPWLAPGDVVDVAQAKTFYPGKDS